MSYKYHSKKSPGAILHSKSAGFGSHSPIPDMSLQVVAIVLLSIITLKGNYSTQRRGWCVTTKTAIEW